MAWRHLGPADGTVQKTFKDVSLKQAFTAVTGLFEIWFFSWTSALRPQAQLAQLTLIKPACPGLTVDIRSIAIPTMHPL